MNPTPGSTLPLYPRLPATIPTLRHPPPAARFPSAIAATRVSSPLPAQCESQTLGSAPSTLRATNSPHSHTQSTTQIPPPPSASAKTGESPPPCCLSGSSQCCRCPCLPRDN